MRHDYETIYEDSDQQSSIEASVVGDREMPQKAPGPSTKELEQNILNLERQLKGKCD